METVDAAAALSKKKKRNEYKENSQ